MKIRFFKLALAAVLLGGMISCVQEEPTRVPAKMDLENADELGKAALTFSNRAETKTVNFTADGDWYIRVPKDCDWLTVSPKEGSAGDVAVNISTKLYEAEEARTATLAFVVDGLEQKATLDVTQLQKFHLTAEVPTTVVPKTGGDVVIDIVTNGTYSCTIDAAGSSWLSVAEEAKNKLTLSAKAIGEGALKNFAKVTIACVEDESLTQVLDFSQKNLELSFSAKEINSNGHAAEGVLDVNIINVENWSLESSAPWLTVEKSGNKVNFSMPENLTYADREATITIQCLDSVEDADVMSVVKVKQLVAADLIDFIWNEEGVAVDASVMAHEVTSNTTGATMSKLNDYALWGPTVAHGENQTVTTGYWKALYEDYMSNVEDGYTMESVFCITAPHGNKETKAFSATGSGGYAIMLGNTNSNYGSKETIQFIQHDGSTWQMAVTDIKPEVNRIYHVVGVWDKAAGELRCYVDGELAATKKCTGFKHMTTTRKYVTVCANHTNASQNGSWNGSVFAARMYDHILTPEQIKSKYEMKVNFQIVK